jgi:hypothetical protein
VLSFRRVAQTRQDVFAGEVREVGEDLLLRHPRGQIGEHVVHGDAHPVDARLTAALSGLDGDDAFVRHVVILLGNVGRGRGFQ